MFGEFSTKEMLIWVAGMLVAAAVIIVGAIYAVNTFIAPRSQGDPLTTRGGLNNQKDIRQK
jgi:hypothetical protein